MLMETLLAIISFITIHWGWISILLLGIFGILKMLAKRTKFVWDDKIITFIIGLIRMSRGKEPLSRNTQIKIEKDVTKKKKEVDKEYYKNIEKRGEELE
jgi:hypothetical protein